MNQLLIYEIGYVVVLILFCLRIIYDTRSTSKALGYMLLVIFLPVIGIIFYSTFGTNYRKRKIYSKKLIEDDRQANKLRDDILQYSKQTFEDGGIDLQSSKELAYMLAKDRASALTANNDVKLLINGENKFPLVLQAILDAKDHIHMEYYIYEDDEIGKAIEKLLIQKAEEGVTVRFIYDDFGSRAIRKRLVPRLKNGGVQAFPFYKVIFMAAANRINYRNHRKIIVVDGKVGFVGGINISDRYSNNKGGK